MKNERSSNLLVEEGQALRQLGGFAERCEVIVIGGGQAGLSIGYHLARKGVRFVILEGRERIGDVWRERWDSLRLFTPAAFDSLDGMRFPAPRDAFPTKDEFADYLEAYARKFQLPVRTGMKVDRVFRRGDRYLVSAGARKFEAPHVVVAMGHYQRPKVPALANELNRGIVQIHSRDYQRPSQLAPGDVLIVGAGNSGAEIARDLAGEGRRIWLAGRSTGELPFRIGGFLGRKVLVHLVLGVGFRHVLTVNTPPGRKVRAQLLAHGGPLIRVRYRDLEKLGVERVARVAGVRDGKPVLEDGRALDVANVVWCTGFHSGFSWIDLPIFEESGEPRHDRGVVEDQPGFYFVGLAFQYAAASGMIQGVGRDARHIAAVVAKRIRTAPEAARPEVPEAAEEVAATRAAG